MTMQVNGNSAPDNIVNEHPIKPAADGNRQEPVSIFSDKNNNGIVDKNDFDDEATAQLAFEKGLLGRSWDAVKDFIDKLLTTDATENLTKETRYDETTNENYQADIDSSGKEVRRTYYKSDGSIACIENIEYDENGNPAKSVWLDADGNLDSICILDKNGDETHETAFYSDGTVREEWDYINGEPKTSAKHVEGFGLMTVYNGTNGADFVKTINTVISSKMQIEEKLNILKTLVPDALNIGELSDGGSIVIDLTDGTKIKIADSLNGDKDITITHPDRTVEKYSREGELLE